MDKKQDQHKTDAREKKKSTDPQEHMEGPISSLVQDVKEEVEKNDEESKKEADKKKNDNK